ncbi:MAG: putative molybdenum carrier protein [Desulfosalsimonadaceae bacterium]
MTIQKIVSGGQTGADRAALDFAIEYGIEHGGWVPEGRRAEDGILPMQYNVVELPGGDYPDRTARNVMDADGTLIISHGELTGGSLLTRALAEKQGKPVFHVDMGRLIAFDAAIDIHEWMAANDIEVLNVAGPRESKDPAIYKTTRNLLETVFHIDIIADSMPGAVRPFPSGKGFAETEGGVPHTVEQAVEHLMDHLPAMDKIRIASAKKERLRDFTDLLRREFGLDSGNRALIENCEKIAGLSDADPDAEMDAKGASMVILRIFWEKLRQSGHLRVIK